MTHRTDIALMLPADEDRNRIVSECTDPFDGSMSCLFSKVEERFIEDEQRYGRKECSRQGGPRAAGCRIS